MKNKCAIRGLIGCLALLLNVFPAFAGDSLYGRVTEVKSADTVVLDYGKGQYVVHIIGINPLKEGVFANQARELVAKLVLGKNARMRLGSRAENGEMFGQLFTDDPENGIKDVGLELVRSGLVQRQRGQDYQFGYKYGELSTAERQARAAKRGLWASSQSK